LKLRSTIINVGSGKYLNIDSGVDEEGRNVNQYQGYPAAQQQFHYMSPLVIRIGSTQ